MNIKPLNLVIVGLGAVGLKHLKAALNLKNFYNLTAIVDRNPLKVKKFLEKEKLYKLEDVDKLTIRENLSEVFNIEELKIDAVAICTPSNLHYEQAVSALEHGCHVILEKPMAMNSVDCNHLCSLAAKQNLHIIMGHIYRYFPCVDDIKEDIKQDVYGDLIHATAKILWGHNQEYYYQAPWRGTWACDGGALLNQSIHAIDLLMYLLDEIPVSAQAWLKQMNHIMEAEDLAYVSYKMDNNVNLSLLGTTAGDERQACADIDLIFTRGRLKASYQKNSKSLRLEVYDADKTRNKLYYIKKTLKKSWKKDTLNRGFFSHLKDFFHPHRAIYADLIMALQQGREVKATAKDGEKACMLIFAAYKSALNSSMPVHLPLNDFDCKEMTSFFETMTIDKQIELED